MSLSVLDALIIACYLCATVSVGYAAKKYIASLDAFLVAGRAMRLHLGIASLISSEIGIITYMYFAELGYLAGFSSFIVGVIACIVFLVIGITGVCVTKLRHLNIMTVPEYLGLRYGTGVRVFAGALMTIGGVLNFGIFPVIEAKFLNIMFGVREDYAVATMAILVLVALLYTFGGGMVSVLVTNYVQYVFLSAGTLLVTIIILSRVGWSSMTSAVTAHVGPQGYNPLSNTHFGFFFIFWQLLFWIGIAITWQSIAMRTFSAKDPQINRRLYTYSSLLYLSRALLPMSWGIGALAYLGHDIEPIRAMPTFLSSILPHGILGLVASAMLAASMSTYSSYLLAWSSIISQDVVAPLLRRPLNDRQQLVLNRSTIVSVTLFILFWSIFYRLPGPAYFYLSVTANIFLGGVLASIVLGLYWKRANRNGAYLALLLSAASSLSFFFLSIPPDISGFGSFLLAFVGMVIGSFVSSHRRSGASEITIR